YNNSGAANVSNGASWDQQGNLYVGRKATGRLNIASGGSVATSGGATLGDYQNSVGEVGVADGKWTIGDLLVVGDQGQGRLTVSDGGVVTGNTQTSNATVGSGAGSQGRVTVDGDGSRWAFQRLTVGDAGNGRVTVTDGGVVDSKRQDVRIATQGGSTGTLRIGDGGRPGELSQGVQVTFGAGDGMLVFGHTDANYSFDSALKSQIAGAGKIEHYAG